MCRRTQMKPRRSRIETKPIDRRSCSPRFSPESIDANFSSSSSRRCKSVDSRKAILGKSLTVIRCGRKWERNSWEMRTFPMELPRPRGGERREDAAKLNVVRSRYLYRGRFCRTHAVVLAWFGGAQMGVGTSCSSLPRALLRPRGVGAASFCRRIAARIIARSSRVSGAWEKPPAFT